MGIIVWIAITSTRWFSGRGLHVKQSCHMFAYVRKEARCAWVHTRAGGLAREGSSTTQGLPQQSTGNATIREHFEPLLYYSFVSCKNGNNPGRNVNGYKGHLWFTTKHLFFSSSEVSSWFLFQPTSSRCGFSPQESGVQGPAISELHSAGHSDWLRPGHMTLASSIRVNLRTSVRERLFCAHLSGGEASAAAAVLPGEPSVSRVYHIGPKVKSSRLRGGEEAALRVFLGLNSSKLWSKIPDLKAPAWAIKVPFGVRSQYWRHFFLPLASESPDQ